jgi:hypothetical protein
MIQFPSGGNFYDVFNFNGNYDGIYDGRSAKLKIEATQSTDGQTTFVHLTFTGSEAVFEGRLTLSGADDNKNFCLNNITLTSAKHGSVSWPKLMLHTHNRDLLSGYSEWNGGSFGMFFWKLGEN